jgi:hypothetical protein
LEWAGIAWNLNPDPERRSVRHPLEKRNTGTDLKVGHYKSRHYPRWRGKPAATWARAIPGVADLKFGHYIKRDQQDSRTRSALQGWGIY